MTPLNLDRAGLRQTQQRVRFTMTGVTPTADFALSSGAVFSGCRHYRHLLWRSWQPGLGCVTFIGLNPSTADADHEDPTIRRCKQFVADWGFGAMIMVNLFDIRATQPQLMKRKARPVSRCNDSTVLKAAAQADLIVAAWGGNGHHRKRSQMMRSLLESQHLQAHCFSLGKNGEPVHPLYQRRESRAESPL